MSDHYIILLTVGGDITQCGIRKQVLIVYHSLPTSQPFPPDLFLVTCGATQDALVFVEPMLGRSLSVHHALAKTWTTNGRNSTCLLFVRAEIRPFQLFGLFAHQRNDVSSLHSTTALLQVRMLFTMVSAQLRREQTAELTERS